MIELSIIVPIYNGMAYLDKLIRNFSNQTKKDFELILVNDGSTDDSYEELINLTKNRENIKVFSKTNGGICSARNYGIKKASGNYIVFIDQDDCFDEKLAEDYYTTIVRTKADMVVFAKTKQYIEADGTTIEVQEETTDRSLLNDETILLEVLNIHRTNTMMTIWNCIYKKEIIDQYHLKFDEHFKHGNEDGMFNMEYALHSKHIEICSRKHYLYQLRFEKSTIAKYNPEIFEDIDYFLKKMDDIIKERLPNKYLNYLYLYNYRFYISGYYKVKSQAKSKKMECKLNYLKNVAQSAETREISNYSYKLLGQSSAYYRAIAILSKLLIRRNYFCSMLLLDCISIARKARDK